MMSEEVGHLAMLWEPLEGQEVQCRLCGFGCRIKAGKRGHCLVRENRAGVLYSLNYSAVCSVNVDPIEKKTFVSFLSGLAKPVIRGPGMQLSL